MKRLGFLVTLLLLIGLLVGCGTQGEESASSDGAEKVQIEFWYGLTGFLGDTVEEKIQAFNQSQDKYEVVGVQQGDYEETYQKLQAAVAAGDAPGVVLLDDYQFVPLAEKKVLAPLDEMIEEKEDFNAEDFTEVFYNQGKVDGAQYGIPAIASAQIMYYRKDIFEEEGISPDVLNDWETLYDAAEKLTKKENGETVFYGWMPMWGSYNLIDSALSNGGTYVSEDGKTVTIDSPEWVEAWDYFHKAIIEDEIMGFHHGGQGWEYWYKTIDDVMEGRAAGYIGSSGDLGDLDFNIIGAHVQPGWNGEKTKAQAGAGQLAVPNIIEDEEKQAAFEWMSFFTNTENTADWGMKTGYIPVRQSAAEDPAFKEFAEENPQILVSMEQVETATVTYLDPTGGQIHAALEVAADRMMIEGVSAEEVLADAQEEAQQALDEIQ